MDERIKTLRNLEPSNSGRASYLAILEAAAGLFGQFPAEDITLRDILSISGVSNQTLYNYFPSGRDDIAIALYDRFQRTIVIHYKNNMQSINIDGEMVEDLKIVTFLSACLARAIFGFLQETYTLQATLFRYLQSHHLTFIASHADELEAAMEQELSLRFGHRFAKAELPRIVRLSVHTVRGIADQAMLNRAFPLDELESNARKMVRSLLQTGLRGKDGPSGIHDFQPHASGPIVVMGATISPVKKKGILDRILKRKRRA